MRSTSPGIEGRVADDVGEQVERRPEIGRQRGQRHRRAVEAGAGADGGAEPLLRLGELDRVEAGRAFLEHVQHHRLGAEPVGRIGGDAGVELDRDAGHRDDVAAGIDDADAVRELGALDRREIERRGIADGRHFALVERSRRERLIAGLRRGVVTGALAGRADVDAGRAAAGHARRFLIGLALAGIDAQRVDRPAQPALHGGADLLRRHRRELRRAGVR